MINQTSVKQALNVDIAISPQMAEALQQWAQMYENKAEWLSTDIKSLNLPAAIAGEIARAVTIEMTVEISGSPRADYLDEQFENVVNVLRQYVEFGEAKGGLMMKPFVNGKNISVDFVQADQFFPVAFDANGNITACVFSDQRQVGGNYYTRLEYHTMTPAGCQITNRAYKSQTRDTLGQQVQLTELDAWADLTPDATITGIDRPLFAYFKNPQANNIDPTSPLGVSCFSRAVELIEQADNIWSDLLWEFESGQRALYVDELAFGKDKNGKAILPNKRLYRTIETGSTEGDMYEEWSPTLREVNILNGLDAILRKIEFTCGLAYGTLSNPATVDKTATELKISQQRSYATITDTQKALEESLEQLLWAMDIWATLSGLAPMGAYEAVYDFDDSVIVDKDLQFQQDMRLVTSRLMSPIEFRMRNFGESEELAKKMLAMIAPAPVDVFGNVGA
jgi:A118 family predicted phage portal protein